MKYLYRTYQLLIALPLIAIYTIITSLIVIIGCSLGNGHFWGYYPGKWWVPQYHYERTTYLPDHALLLH